MQNTHREVLLDTYEDVIQLSELLGHKGIIDNVFNAYHTGKRIIDLTDSEIAKLINQILKSLLSLQA